MGHIRHHAIVVTSWSEKIVAVAEKARELRLQVLGPSDKAINGYRSILVCPDGSKEWWPDSDAGDERRAQFIDFLKTLRYEDFSSAMEWVEMSYGADPREAVIETHAWDHDDEG
jgi:hypothetical protein